MLVQRRQWRLQHKGLLLRARAEARQASVAHRCASLCQCVLTLCCVIARSRRTRTASSASTFAAAESSHAILSCYVKFTGISGRESMCRLPPPRGECQADAFDVQN